MDIISTIKNSNWWRDAEKMPDNHYTNDAGISLADHLTAVHDNLNSLLSKNTDQFWGQFLQSLTSTGLIISEITEILAPVALIHDIGKTMEDKITKIEHPLTGKLVEKRHPIVGVIASLELLPVDLPNRESIISIIEQHDTPYSWFQQFQKNGQIPKRKSWARLDRKIDSKEDGTGLILLSIFKIADIHGHKYVDDVKWFIEQANINYLNQKGKSLPVPDIDNIKSVSNSDR